MGCQQCQQATTITERECLSSWSALAIDDTTASIDEGEPIATNVVSFESSFYSSGGMDRILEIELEESATTLTEAATRILVFTGNNAPTAPTANTPYIPATTNLEAVLAVPTSAWQRASSGISRARIAPNYRIQAATDSTSIHLVFLSDVTGPITYSAKGASIRARIAASFVY